MLFHHFALTWALVVDATQVQDAMDDDTMEFTIVGLLELLGIGAHRIERNEQIATDFVPFGIVESDDVCVIVMLQILAVDLEDLLIVAEDIRDLPYPLTMILGDLFHPGTNICFVDSGHLSVALIEKRYCHNKKEKQMQRKVNYKF